MRINLPYSQTHLPLDLPDPQILAVLEPRSTVEGADGEQLLRRALTKAPALPRRAAPLVVLPDITRPFPHRLVVEGLLARYRWDPEQVTLLFGGGNHTGHTPAEHEGLVGPELARACTLVDHNAYAEGLVEVGVTRRGTPVQLNPLYLEAELRLACGLVEYHPFAGYSGGYKAVMPGVAGAATIEANHRLALEPGATIGGLEGNPVALDILEAGRLAPPTLGINLTRDGRGRVDFIGAGELATAQRASVEAYEQTHRLPVVALADTVIVSSGGFPRDIDWRQASKALDFAALACRPGGTLICLAACPKGLGDPRLDRFLRTGWPDLLEQQKEHFELGSQRATHILEVASRYRVIVVTEMEPALLEGAPLELVASLDEALTMAGESQAAPTGKLSGLGSVTVMRYGTVLPYLG